MSASPEREFLSFKSSVLLISHPDPERVAFGAEFATSLSEAEIKLSQTVYPVIVSNVDQVRTSERRNYFQTLSRLAPESHHVLVSQSLEPREFLNLLGSLRISRLLKNFEDDNFERSVQQALEDHMVVRQNQMLLQLIREQNQQLTSLSTQLEERVDKRQKNLVRARRRLESATQRSEALKLSLVAVHRSSSIAEMERLVNDSLSMALRLSWTRILFTSQNQLELAIEKERVHYTVLTTPLLRESSKIGHIYFARKTKFPFDKEETDFLLQISEAISLAIGRLTALQLSEEIKQQWETTFNSITTPVSLLTSRFEIIRVNRSYAEKTAKGTASLSRKKCFEAFFNRTEPCENCKLGYNFRIHQKGSRQNTLTIYDVSSQNVSFEKDFFTYVNIYRDVSDQLKLERQIVESAKMAELGTIGSSIAHELNNPIGGIITFLQLMKMDLTGKEPFFKDLTEMESAAQRCREIIQNLLSFTRTSENNSIEQVDLKDVIRKAIQILELQSRSMGVKLDLKLPSKPVLAQGNFNLLSHALINLLQVSIDGVLRLMREEVSYSGIIRVTLEEKKANSTIEITDNRPGLRRDQPFVSSSLGLRQTVAAQIISEVGGSLEISSDDQSRSSAKISIPRLVF